MRDYSPLTPLPTSQHSSKRVVPRITLIGIPLPGFASGHGEEWFHIMEKTLRFSVPILSNTRHAVFWWLYASYKSVSCTGSFFQSLYTILKFLLESTASDKFGKDILIFAVWVPMIGDTLLRPCGPDVTWRSQMLLSLMDAPRLTPPWTLDVRRRRG